MFKWWRDYQDKKLVEKQKIEEEYRRLQRIQNEIEKTARDIARAEEKAKSIIADQKIYDERDVVISREEFVKRLADCQAFASYVPRAVCISIINNWLDHIKVYDTHHIGTVWLYQNLLPYKTYELNPCPLGGYAHDGEQLAMYENARKQDKIFEELAQSSGSRVEDVDNVLHMAYSYIQGQTLNLRSLDKSLGIKVQGYGEFVHNRYDGCLYWKINCD